VHVYAGVDVSSSGQSYKAPLKSQDETPSRVAGGGLSRSHSSPNIAKMIHNEESVAAVATGNQSPRQPALDRSTKPQMT